MAWMLPVHRYSHQMRFHGLDELRAAKNEGHGVILLGMHLSTLDLAGAALSEQVPFNVMYRRNKNQLIEAVMTQGRARNFPHSIQRDDVRAVIKHLKAGHVVWYGPDQDYGAKHSLFAPFFGVTAATITATARIARIAKSPIILFSHYRRDDNLSYDVHLNRVLPDFPTDDPVADAACVNKLIEDSVKHHPEQYWWLHRRFKTRPPGQSRPY